MYVVVEFEEIEGGGIAIVRDSWITPRKKEVYWPPYKQTQLYKRALKLDESINNNWKCCKIKRSFYETDDFAKAVSKLRQAEDTSDLQSDGDGTVKRRKRQAPRTMSSSSDEECGANTYMERFERPPPVNRIYQDRNSRSDTDVSICSLSKSASKSLSSAPVKSELFTRQGSPSAVNLESPSTSTACPSTQTTPVSSFLDKGLNDNKRDQTLFSLLYTIKEQNIQILNILLGQQGGIELPENLFPQLPLSTEDDLEILEKQIQDKENSKRLVTFLARLGGKDVVSKINKILKGLISDDLASKYNFLGQRSKKPFNELLLKSVIVDAVKSSSLSATTREVEDLIKVWLKHAPQRIIRNRKSLNTSN